MSWDRVIMACLPDIPCSRSRLFFSASACDSWESQGLLSDCHFFNVATVRGPRARIVLETRQAHRTRPAGGGKARLGLSHRNNVPFAAIGTPVGRHLKECQIEPVPENQDSLHCSRASRKQSRGRRAICFGTVSGHEGVRRHRAGASCH